jgi:very-short-patch-repair endonuclease
MVKARRRRGSIAHFAQQGIADALGVHPISTRPKQNSFGDVLTTHEALVPFVKKQQKKAEKVSPEDLLDEQLRLLAPLGFPKHVRQLMFAKQEIGRQWKFDFAWPEYKLAAEVDGLVVMRDKYSGELVVKGRHATIDGFREDCVKGNTAIMLGWQVLHFEQSMVTSKNEARDTIVSVLQAKGWRRTQ